MATKEISETAFLIAWGRSTDPSLSLDPYIPGLKLIEHVGFKEIQTRLSLDKPLTDDELIDERFFLLEKSPSCH